MLMNHFYVCSTDKTHDIITVLTEKNNFCHGHFDNLRDAENNARSVAKNAGSYYVPLSDNTEYVILQFPGDDTDSLVPREELAHALSNIQSEYSVMDILEDIDLQEWALSDINLLWTDSIKQTRTPEQRKRARFCRKSPNNISPEEYYKNLGDY